MNLTLKIWRQKDANEKGKIVDYPSLRHETGNSRIESAGYYLRRW